MKERLLKEYQEKLSSKSVDELLKAPVYAMILTYIESEELNNDWVEKLSAKDNILDYLYKAVIDFRRTTYEDVKNALVFDQISH